MGNICELRGGIGCSQEKSVLGASEVQGLIDKAIAALPAPTTGVTQAQMDARLAALPIPTATVAMPAGVADNSQQGTDPLKFEPAGHVHASKARKQRKTGVNTLLYIWVYPAPFGTGVIPICNAIVEDPANNANDVYNAQVVGGSVSNTQCTFRITRQTVGLFALLTGALGINPTPGNVALHMTALEP